MAARARSLLQTPVYELRAYKRFVRSYRERFSLLGRRSLIAMIVLGVLAIDTRRNQTFLLFAISAGLQLSAMIMVRFARARAKLLLNLPGRAVVGEELAIRGRVIGQGEGLLRATFTSRPDPRRLAIEPDEVIVPAADESEFRFVARPHRRGRYELGSVSLRPLDPLGLVTGPAVDATRGSHVVLVAPAIFEWTLRTGAIGRRLQPGGIPLASSTSDSLELVGTREWRPGDRLRNVHWRSFARRGVPIVKEFHEEYFPRIAIVVDTHVARSKKGEDASVAFEAALSVAGSVAAALARADHVVELLAAGPELYRIAAGRGLGPIDGVLDVLACVEPSNGPGVPLSDVAPAIEDEIAQLGTVVVVLLDWDEARAAFVERARALGAEVHAVVVREGPTALPFPEDGSDDTIERMPPSAVARAITGAS